ncbi:VRR-NUC domain-containing protein [Enterovibrio sp. 27052020O]|uniref:VRR-NUC domain-containing protein n=1 Tax=Enterovibrio sp. 27052020O TaxID=3241166 RepID=UPI0038907842
MLDNVYSLERQLGRIKQGNNGSIKKVRREPETQECADMVRWARKTRIAGLVVGDYLVHVPNEGKRGKKAKSDFYRLGGQPGYPDYIFDVARCGYHGLRIEAKAPVTFSSVIGDDQRKWAVRLTEQGYLHAFCYSSQDMKDLITDYLMDRIEGPSSQGSAA